MTGTPWDKFPPDLLEKDRQCEYDYRPFGGESAQDVRDRLNCFLEHAQKVIQPNESGLVVCHGGVMRLLYKDYKGEIRNRFNNGEIQVFEF